MSNTPKKHASLHISTDQYRQFDGTTRYGLTYVKPTEAQRASGWRQVWRHPSGALALRHPSTGQWVVSMDGHGIGEGWSNSLRAAALKIDREAGA